MANIKMETSQKPFDFAIKKTDEEIEALADYYAAYLPEEEE